MVILTSFSKFAGLQEDEPIPREWMKKMDEWQHELEASITWDAGDVLLVDVSRSCHHCKIQLLICFITEFRGTARSLGLGR